MRLAYENVGCLEHATSLYRLLPISVRRLAEVCPEPRRAPLCGVLQAWSHIGGTGISEVARTALTGTRFQWLQVVTRQCTDVRIDWRLAHRADSTTGLLKRCSVRLKWRGVGVTDVVAIVVEASGGAFIYVQGFAAGSATVGIRTCGPPRLCAAAKLHHLSVLQPVNLGRVTLDSDSLSGPGS